MKKRIYMLLAISCLSLGLLVGCNSANNPATPQATDGTTTGEKAAEDLKEAGDKVEDALTGDGNNAATEGATTTNTTKGKTTTNKTTTTNTTGKTTNNMVNGKATATPNTTVNP